MLEVMSLRLLGYENVHQIGGGIVAWEKSNRPVVSSQLKLDTDQQAYSILAHHRQKSRRHCDGVPQQIRGREWTLPTAGPAIFLTKTPEFQFKHPLFAIINRAMHLFRELKIGILYSSRSDYS